MDNLQQFDLEQAVLGPRKGRTPSPSDFEAAPNVMIQCPGGKSGLCDSAVVLKDNAGFVADALDIIAEKYRTSEQENNLGCARVRLVDWKSAKEAFARAIEKAKTDDDLERAKANLRLARSVR